MRPDALDAAIAADRARRPHALRGRRDDRHARRPPRSIRSTRSPASRAQHGLWLHVDAAMAGSAMILPECRWMWDGIERADSLVVNPHKWLGAAFDCSLYYVRDAEHLVRVMSTNPSYLQSSADGRVKNLRDWGIPLGRRFRALKLWFLIREQGVARPAGAAAPRPRERAVARRARCAPPPAGACSRRCRCRRCACATSRAGLDGEALDRHTLGVGRSRQPIGRRLSDAGDPRRPLDGARLDRRAQRPSARTSRSCGTRCARRRNDDDHQRRVFRVGGRARALRAAWPREHALDLRGAGGGDARLGRRRQGVSGLHERHRRPEHRPSPSPRRPRRARAGRSADAHLLSGRDVRAIRRAGRAALRSRRRRPQGDSLDDRRGSDRERGQDRPRAHPAAGGGGVYRRIPRTHAAQPRR